VYKIRSKKLTILLTLIFVLSIMLPLAVPAGAATTYSALTAPSVPQTTAPGTTVDLGTIFIAIDALGVGTHSAVFRLPSSVTLPAVLATPSISPALAPPDTITVARLGNQEFRLDLTTSAASGLLTDVKITVPITGVTTAAASGDITCTITSLSGQLPDGSVVVGKAPSGQVSVSMVSTPTMGLAGRAVSINIQENIAGGLAVDAVNSLEFALPTGFDWSGASIINVATGLPPGVDGIGVSVVPGDTRKLRVVRTGVTAPRMFLRVTATITPSETLAKFGDVTATIGGASSTNVNSLLVAKYAEFGVSVSAKTVEDALAGRAAQKIGDFYVKEAVPGSLIAGRSITFKLPDNAVWNTNPTVVVEKGDITLGALVAVDTRTLRVPITAGSSATAAEILLRDGRVTLAADTVGDLNLEFSGQSGATGTLKVANVLAPVTVSAATPDVIIGQKNQAAGNFTIVESRKGAIDRTPRMLTVAGPNGVSFAKVPKVEVTSGDLRIDSVTVTGGELRIVIRSDSTVASTIAVSDVAITVDRTVPVGPIVFDVNGDAINQTATTFPAAGCVAKVALANVVTPAPAETKRTAAFVIGSTTYTVGGVEATMDVAPYVKDGRTYLPIRFAGQALGVAEENIFWDNATRTATLIKGDRVVQFTVGQKAVVINGARVAIDVAPEITNKRTMLPFRHIATAFGASVLWDATTQTVTMEL